MSLTATAIKNYVQANLIGLHGNIGDFEINKFTTTGDTTEISGVFKISFDYKDYEFTMVIDKQGNMISYDRKQATKRF
jgi:hypothetical protein